MDEQCLASEESAVTKQHLCKKRGMTGIAASTAKIAVLSTETVIAIIHILAVHILKEKD